MCAGRCQLCPTDLCRQESPISVSQFGRACCGRAAQPPLPGGARQLPAKHGGCWFLYHLSANITLSPGSHNTGVYSAPTCAESRQSLLRRIPLLSANVCFYTNSTAEIKELPPPFFFFFWEVGEGWKRLILGKDGRSPFDFFTSVSSPAEKHSGAISSPF